MYTFSVLVCLVRTGAVCVYPSRVADCRAAVDGMKADIPIASGIFYLFIYFFNLFSPLLLLLLENCTD
jgi:hypothetical protein